MKPGGVCWKARASASGVRPRILIQESDPGLPASALTVLSSLPPDCSTGSSAKSRARQSRGSRGQLTGTRDLIPESCAGWQLPLAPGFRPAHRRGSGIGVVLHPCRDEHPTRSMWRRPCCGIGPLVPKIMLTVLWAPDRCPGRRARVHWHPPCGECQLRRLLPLG